MDLTLAPQSAPSALAVERLVVTVLMSDVRGYSGIAERTDPVVLAGQLDAHRREMAAAVRDAGGTIVQYAGDAVLAVFGAPAPLAGHQELACRAATAMHRRQRLLDELWAAHGLEPFGLGIGVSTGEVAAAVLGGADHLEYTIVGDTVNLAQRLQVMARRPGTTVVSAATAAGVPGLPGLAGVDLVELAPTMVKGRDGLVRAFRLDDEDTPSGTTAAGGARCRVRGRRGGFSGLVPEQGRDDGALARPRPHRGRASLDLRVGPKAGVAG